MENNDQNSNGTQFLATTALTFMKFGPFIFMTGFIIVIILLVIIIFGGRTSAMEAISNSGGGRGCSGGSDKSWASFISDEEEATTFYKKLNSLVEEKNVDINMATAILTYGNPPSLNDHYACNSEEKNNEGEVTRKECETPEKYSSDIATKLYDESVTIVNGIAGKDESGIREWLKNNFIEDRLKEIGNGVPSDENADEKSKYLDKRVEEIFEMKEQFEDMSCKDPEMSAVGGSCTYKVDGKSATDVYVKLLNCKDEGWGKAIVTDGAEEELIDLEKYILGVTYAEHSNGNEEGIKAQAIAARSYAFGRSISMRGSGTGNQLVQENGKWVLYMRNCTEDQVYCDPDKGCWSNDKSAGGTVHSGRNSSAPYDKGPVATDAKLREIVSSTRGQYAVDGSGKLFSTNYTNIDQIAWNQLGEQGLTVNQILTKHYSGLNSITSECTAGGGLTGDFLKWKQCDLAWKNTTIGSTNYTVCSVGCALTSVSIQVMRSGVQLNVSDFNPGVAAKKFGYTNLAELEWGTTKNVATNFKFLDQFWIDSLKGARSKRQLTEEWIGFLEKGYYIVVNVMNGGHWVALTGYENGIFIMSDPNGADGVDLFGTWPATTIEGYRVYEKVN